MTTRHDYDVGYDPPAPVVPAAVAATGSAMTVALAFLVDTGADITVVPDSVAAQLELPVVGELMVRGAAGDVTQSPVHAVDIDIGGVRGTYEVLSLGEQALLGRDVLRRFVLTLDGPAASMTLSARRPRLA